MLQALLKLAQQGDFNMSVRATQGDNPTMTIVVMPVAKQGQDPALATPVRLSGSPAELEEGFEAALARFIGTRATLIEQVEATETILKNAQAAAAKKGADALKGGKKPAAALPVRASAATAAAPAATAATTPANELDEEEDDAGGDSPLGEAPAASAPAATAPALAVGNLFGD